jgi:LEA14-like dessication related protein
MKKIIPLIAVAALGTGAYFYFNRKKASLQNLRVEPGKIAIDLAKSQASFFTRLYYNVTLNIVNPERANVTVKNVNLNVYADTMPVGSITNNTQFTVNAGTTKSIVFSASIATVGAAMAIADVIRNGLNMPIQVTGIIATDLGDLEINFTKNLGNGMNGPGKKKV